MKDDIVEVYERKKVKYLGKIKGPFKPIVNNTFFEVNLMADMRAGQASFWASDPIYFKFRGVDVVMQDNLVKVCDGRKSTKCDDCKYRFICYTTR